MATIRAARSDEARRIADFQQRMAAETEGMLLHGPTVLAGVEAIFDDPRKGEYIVAVDEDADRIVGALLTLPEWSDWRNGTVLWIHSVYVIPEYRGQGIFRSMYQFLQDKIRNDGSLMGLRLYVDRANTGARKTYEAMGMDGEHYVTYEWMKEGSGGGKAS
ncbi:MAG: N-acetyltransferase family protein [Phycisphaerae bacterium]